MTSHQYRPIPSELTVPESEWETTLENNVSLYGVKWIKKNIKARQTVIANGERPDKKRKAVSLYFWYATFECHRAGEKRNKMAEGSITKGGASGVARDLQKPSKKINCSAKLKVICYKNNPGYATFIYTGEHNHDVGGLNDLQHLPLSKEARELIEQRLKEGFSKRQTRIAIQTNCNKFITENQVLAGLDNLTSSLIHRDQMVHADEIYNIYKKIQEKFY
ncbi:hypothetical protein BD408DRAFT_384629 [Parasitella parasitica]|nr:hypothetical protein BD408DRAFT_384629 [Parasitella parasitica]